MELMHFIKDVKPGEWAIVFATLFGPIFAVQAQKRLEQLRERFNRKVWVFSTLLNTRVQRLSRDHVRALNMIDVAYYGSRLFGLRYQSRAEKVVVSAWNVYLDNLSTEVTGITDAQWAVLNAKRTELFIDLLWAISKSVGYDFDRLHLQKSVYLPVAHGKQEEQEEAFRAAALEVFSGSKSLKLDIASLPTNPEVAQAYAMLVKQLAAATADGQLAVKSV